MFSARPAPAPPDHPPLAEVKNQTAKRLVIASAIDDDDQLILPPFNTIRIADGDLATYRYEPWCKRGLITVRWSDERPAPTVAGRDTDAAVGPYGWLTTVIGVVVVAEAIPLLGPPTWQNYAAWIAVGVVLLELAAAYLLFRKVKQVQQGLTDVVRKQPPLSRRALGGVLAAARQAAAWTDTISA